MAASLDPRTPVLIGVGQISNRVDQGAAPLEPITLMAEAVRLAGGDSGVEQVLTGPDSIRIPMIFSWRYGDPGRLVAARIGAAPRQSMYTVVGGNYVQTLVNRTALDI